MELNDYIKELRNLNESSLSRLWQHSKSDGTFAIIGSQDKDTREDRGKELYSICNSLVGNNIGYKKLKGRYQYKDGSIGEENSAIIFNIPKDKALDICHKLNQESIVWKDRDFFGIINSDSSIDSTFTSDPENMSFKDVETFGSRLANRKNDLFAFKFQEEVSHENNTITRYRKANTILEDIYEWVF